MSPDELERLRMSIARMGLKLRDSAGLDATDVCPVACVLLKYDPEPD